MTQTEIQTLNQDYSNIIYLLWNREKMYEYLPSGPFVTFYYVYNPTNFLDMKKDYQVAKTRGLEGVKNNKFINKFINI